MIPEAGSQFKIVSIAFLAVFTLLGCDRKESATSKPTMTIEQIIQAHVDSPVGVSIGPITESLAKQSVFIATAEVAPTQDGKLTGTSKIQFKVGKDNQGRPWAYAYTSEAQFSKAFPQGGPFAEMSFPDVFKIIESDPKFAGIYLNSASDTFYPIPRELFDHVTRALQKE